MAKRAYDNLKNRAAAIKNETLADANTASRVGSAVEDILDSAVLEYDPSRSYKTDELAYRQGVVYQAIYDVPPGAAPPDDRYWTAYAASAEEIIKGNVRKPVHANVLYQLLSTYLSGSANGQVIGYADVDKAGIALLLREAEALETDPSNYNASKILTLKLLHLVLDNRLKAYTKVDLEQARQNGTGQINGDVVFRRLHEEDDLTKLVLEGLQLPHVPQVESIKWLLGLDDAFNVVKTSRGPLLDLIDDETTPGVPVNQTPVAAVIADQTIAQGQQWTFQHGIFNDDQGVTYSITTALPAGISYRPTTREFYGTSPVAIPAGALITVRGTDPFGQYAEESFTLFVTAVQATLTMQQPTWNAATRIVTINATASDTTTVLEYKISGLRDWGVDPNFTVPLWLLGALFTLEARQGSLSQEMGWIAPVAGGNRDPFTVGTIPNQTAKVGTAYSYAIPNIFNDPDGDTLTYTANQLPAGLSMSLSGVISGTPTQAIRDMYVTITANDGDGGTGDTFFFFTVNPSTATLVITGATYEVVMESGKPVGYVTIATSGGDGTQKQFLIPQLTSVWQNSNVFRVTETLYQNGGPVTLTARQGQAQVTYPYTVPAAATGGITRIGLGWFPSTGLATPAAFVTDSRTYEAALVPEGDPVTGFAILENVGFSYQNLPGVTFNRVKLNPFLVSANGNYTLAVQPVGSASERKTVTVALGSEQFQSLVYAEGQGSPNTVIMPANQSVFNPSVSFNFQDANGERWAQITNGSTPSVPGGEQIYVIADGKPVSGFGVATTFKQGTTSTLYLFVAGGRYPDVNPYSSRASAAIPVGNPTGTVTDF